MSIYYPQCAATLQIPDSLVSRGKSSTGVELEVRVKRAQWIVNSAYEADVLHLTCEYDDVGVDPRLMKNAVVRFWLDDVPPGTSIDTSPHRIRFIGIAKRVHRNAGESSTECVIEAHDWTSLFLASQPFPENAIPSFDMTLRQAYELICDHTGTPADDEGGTYVSSVSRLRDRLVFRPASLESDAKLSSLVSGRLAKLGKPQVSKGTNTSSWDVLSTLCSHLGLICFVDGDQVVVTNTTEFYADDQAPTMIYGKNITSVSEHVNSESSGKGIALRSFEPEAGRVIEAFYPTKGDPRIHVKRAAAKKQGEADVATSQYDWFDYYSVTDPEALLRIAKGAYEERSRQELQGEFTTAEMAIDGFSLLDLRAGSTIAVHVDPQANVAARIPSESDRIAYLLSIGYSDNMSTLIARNAAFVNLLNSDPFHVRTMTVELSDESFEIRITYQNKIRAF